MTVPTTPTPNYGLGRFVFKTDPGADPLNQNWTTIDTELKANADAIAAAVAAMAALEARAALGLSYFSSRGLLPANLVVGDLSAFPAPDFTNINPGDNDIDVDNLKAYNLANAGKILNAGWELGATYSKVLLIMPSIIAASTIARAGLWIGEAAPPAIADQESIPPSAHFASYSNANNWYGQYQSDGAGAGLGDGEVITYDSDPTLTPNIFPSNQQSGQRMMAIRVDGSNVDLYLATSGPGSWFRLFRRTGVVALTAFTHCGVFMKTAGQVSFAGPAVAFAE